MYDWYPGLKDSGVQRVKDLRPYRDLNDIRYASFLEEAKRAGFRVEFFTINPTLVGKVLVKLARGRVPQPVLEVLSKSASAVLAKPAAGGLSPESK